MDELLALRPQVSHTLGKLLTAELLSLYWFMMCYPQAFLQMDHKVTTILLMRQ